MPDPLETVDEKVVQLFRELSGNRANALQTPEPPSVAVIVDALSVDHEPDVSRDIAFHLCDWAWDAAFLVALHLYPERFTRDEIEAGIGLLIIHAPNHLAAAAKLAGSPVQDIFEVGALDGDDAPPER
jgi:hypothetical protein